ncbi:hypothetical protein ACMFMF_009360 [Clarireedia jacksonii]
MYRSTQVCAHSTGYTTIKKARESISSKNSSSSSSSSSSSGSSSGSTNSSSSSSIKMKQPPRVWEYGVTTRSTQHPAPRTTHHAPSTTHPAPAPAPTPTPTPAPAPAPAASTQQPAPRSKKAGRPNTQARALQPIPCGGAHESSRPVPKRANFQD